MAKAFQLVVILVQYGDMLVHAWSEAYVPTPFFEAACGAVAVDIT